MKRDGKLWPTGEDRPPNNERVISVQNDMQNNCGIILLADNSSSKDLYKVSGPNIFKQNTEINQDGNKTSLWIYKMKNFYQLVNSDEEKCVATDTEYSLFRASKELLSINAEGEIHKSQDSNVALAEIIQNDEEQD